MDAQQQLRELAAKFKTLTVTMKFGREMNSAPDFSSAAAIAANTPEMLLRFRRAALVTLQDKKFTLAGQFGMCEPNPDSDCASATCGLCKSFADLEPGGHLLLQQDMPEFASRTQAKEYFSSLAGEEGRILLFKLPLPGFSANSTFEIFWVLEYAGEVPEYVIPTAQLLAPQIAFALYAHKFCTGISAAGKIRKSFSRRKVTLAVAAAAVIAMFIPFREQINAEFVLRAPEITGAYALFDGPVAQCFKQDGDTVKKGELVALYDTAQLQFRLDSARNKLAEAEKEYELENSASFSDRSRLGKVPLLAARLESARVDVREAQWYLDHSRIFAPADGILALADGRAEKLKNRVLRTGDRIFDIYGGKGMSAEIRVNERDSSILLDDPEATLFLYTQPEIGIPVKITDIRQYPERTEQNVWCYKVLAELDSSLPLRYGMRGVARLRGKPAALGYLLFKNAVLYFRWL